MEIVREGTLQLAVKDPSSKSSKDWKAYLFVLKRDKELKKSVLDYYKDVNKRWQKQERRGSIELWPYFQVSLAHNSSYQYPLMITDANNKEYTFSATSFEVMNKWCTSLQMQSYLVPSTKEYREFLVQAAKSPSTTLIGASGECILAFTLQKQIVCALMPSRQKVGVWPYKSLRKYSGGKDRFCFTAGRRSPRGEGEFVFLSPQGEDIFQYMRRTVQLTSMASQTQMIEGGVSSNRYLESPMGSSESESEGEDPRRTALPHVPPKPTDLSKRMSMGQLPPIPGSGDEVSDPSPAYFTSRGAGDGGSKYLPRTATPPVERALQQQQSVRAKQPGAQVSPQKAGGQPPAIPPNRPPAVPPSPRRAPLPDDEDMYSRATHDLPQAKQRLGRTPSSMSERGGGGGGGGGGESTYQGLVRTESSRSTTRPVRDSISSSSSDQLPDEQVYDLAYLPSGQHQVKMPPLPEGEYGSMGDAEDQRRELLERRLIRDERGDGVGGGGDGGQQARERSGSESEKLLSGDHTPFGIQLRRGTGMGMEGGNRIGGLRVRNGDEGLTSNLMYDSAENILSPSSMAMLPVGTLEGRAAASGGGGGGVGRYEGVQSMEGGASPNKAVNNERHESILKDSVGMDLTDSMVTNPVYGDHKLSMGARRGMISPIPAKQQQQHTRAVSPLRHSLVTNPLYGGRQDLLRPQDSAGAAEGIPPGGVEASGGNVNEEDCPPHRQTPPVDTSTTNQSSSSSISHEAEDVSNGKQSLVEDSVKSSQSSSAKEPQQESKDHPLTISQEAHRVGEAESGSCKQDHARSEALASVDQSSPKRDNEAESNGEASGDDTATASPHHERLERDHTKQVAQRRTLDVGGGGSVVGRTSVSPQRDGRGYSVVDKKRAGESEGPAAKTGSESPPPIPPRKYSDGSDT